MDIIRRAVEEPLRQIAGNAGLEGSIVCNRVKEGKDAFGFIAATGEYEDFLTGFTVGDGNVWGRPVGVTVGKDGSLFVSDDGSNSIWHVRYVGK